MIYLPEQVMLHSMQRADNKKWSPNATLQHWNGTTISFQEVYASKEIEFDSKDEADEYIFFELTRIKLSEYRKTTTNIFHPWNQRN